jgi:hypothetical protein
MAPSSTPPHDIVFFPPHHSGNVPRNEIEQNWFIEVELMHPHTNPPCDGTILHLLLMVSSSSTLIMAMVPYAARSSGNGSWKLVGALVAIAHGYQVAPLL